MFSRYFIKISFKGTNYHGWQVQPAAITVQEILNRTLSLILKEDIITTGAGRTDSGVHASNFIAHFDSRNKTLHTRKDLIQRLNSFLPEDIMVQNIISVKVSDHARYSALSRTYHYVVSTRKNVFLNHFSHRIFWKINLDTMNEACQIIKNHDDFTSFSKQNSNNKTNICHIYQAEWREVSEGIIVFRITANRFLRGMVRALAGTIMDVGRGKITPQIFESILLEKDHRKASMAFPAEGLFLTNITYSEDIEKSGSYSPGISIIPLSDLFF